jgi:hypothetical protein
MQAAEALRRLGGQTGRAELLRHTTRHHLRMALACGSVQRMARGLYALPELPDPLKAAARARGVPSHATAAALLGLGMVFSPVAIHVSVAHGARPPARKGVTYHRRRSLPPWAPAGNPSEVVRHVVLDCATTMPFPQALAVADSALRCGLLEADDLRPLAAGSPGAAPGTSDRVG